MAAMDRFLAIALATLFGLATSSALPRRDNTVENVVLANCIDQNGVKSSYMAYFVGAITNLPTTVAQVSTPPGETEAWEGSGMISVVFQNGVYFNVTIPHPVANGAYAGVGQNNYGNFSCWYDNKPNQYNWGNNTCDMIYDCNHLAAPETTQGNVATTSTTTGTASNTSTSAMTGTASNTSANPAATATPADLQPADQGSGSKGLSKGDIAGIVIGSIAALTGIIALGVACLERWRKLP
jgi:hypothetical protein